MNESTFRDRTVLFLGAGGCGVSGLALMANALGARCIGMDRERTPVTATLEANGIPVSLEPASPQDDDGALPDGCDLVVASAAIPPDNASVQAAEARGVPVLGYAEALGLLQSERTGVSIAGTHGKSTTSAMLCHVLLEGDLDPSYIVGATCPQIGGGSRTGGTTIPRGTFRGRPGLLVAEACEFQRSFHHHRPVVGVISNVEEDHLDIYGTLEAVVEAFAEFARLLPTEADGGRLLIAHDGAHLRTICSRLACRVMTFGFNPAADYHVEADVEDGRVRVSHDGNVVAAWTSRMPGEHNALNAAVAAVLAHWLGVDGATIGHALTSFEGVERRMQRLGERRVPGGRVTVYDDYGHHPTEVETTLRALRLAEKPARLVCVFQPHQHSRTRFLLDEFARSFSAADVVIVPNIYFVRDSEIERTRVSASDLVDRLRARGITAMHLYPFDAVVEQLENICRVGDLLVIMGAGPVGRIGHDFLATAATGAAATCPA